MGVLWESGKMRMMMRFLASPHVKRNTLALGLCLLAALFAVEAKTAWYRPANGPGSDIQSQKARPVDLPALLSHGTTLPPAALQPVLVFLASVAAIAWTGTAFVSEVDPGFHIAVCASPYFSPGLFFRPPPSL